ncbi:shavenoid [Musca autumnalis]|uniref:shavenoid n=1 Tax=Musca autumnalis TaxID=221902 RepID=UPI003CEA31AE
MLTRNVAKNNDTNNMLFSHASMPVLLLFMSLLSFCQGSLLPLQSDLKREEVPTTAGTTSAIAGSDSSAVDNAANSGASEARGVIDSNLNLLPRAATLLLDAMQPSAATAQLYPVNLTRQHEGDIFWTNGVTSCNVDTCVGLSSGTASWLSMGVNKLGSLADIVNGGSGVDSKSHLELLTRQRHKLNIKSSLPLSPPIATLTNGHGNGESCQCRCLPYLTTYREDLGICVDDIHECSLSPFVSGSSSEKIPYVFLPLRGQIIYPSREISFADIRTPVCAVTGAQYLTTNGWSDLRNPIDNDYPFRMFRDEGRTFLQWLGEADLRHKMQGRLIVVHLVCRDMTLPLNMSSTSDHIMPPKNVFSPCVAFRVNGSPVKFANNVSEVLFQSEATTTLASTSDGMSTKEYIVIGVCSLLLGLIYVSSVFLYLHMKKRKGRDQPRMRNSLDDLANEINYPKNDQVTFGAPFTRSGSLYSVGSMATSNEPRSRGSLSSLKEEMGIVKNNPLLQHFPQLNDHHSGFTSDISNSASECEMDGGYHDKMKQMQTNALIHPQMGMMSSGGGSSDSPKGSHHSSSNGNGGNGSSTSTNEDNLDNGSNGQETECLPQENVAIIEDIMTEEKLENLRAMVNGNVRKKLYFNPAYFEPHLLAQPPPAALEFLQKIREVIAIAKYKMAAKRYQPSLIMIPEENSARSDTPSLFGSQAQGDTCQACANNRCSGHVKNCGDKRNTIEKWLETVNLNEENQNGNATANNQRESVTPSPEKDRQSPRGSTSSSSQSSNRPQVGNSTSTRRGRKEIMAPKQRPPPPPATKPQGSNSNNQNKNNEMEKLHEEEEEMSPDHHQRQETEGDNATFQNYEKPAQPMNSLNIPILHHKLETYSAITASAYMYGYAETGGELYNNPKFTLHDSPNASQRSRSSSQRSKTSRKRLDVLDHYAAASTPTSLTSAERQHYHMLRNMEQMNDSLDAEALIKEYTATLRSNSSFHVDIPTPDYDSTMEKKIKDIYNNTQGSVPSVPTPDYSSLSRRSLKQYQPDSPIYRRKSPQYLIVDYETDSLERLESTKRKSSQSSSSPSSDVSSQLSPSLSTALPLEEELEISHTVFGHEGGTFQNKSLNTNQKKILRAMDSNSLQKDIAARIKYDTPFRGSMTIEVEHEPPSDLERSTDSDQYEPDTLDRKPKKQSFCDVSNWSSVSDIKKEVSSPPQSLPDMNHQQRPLASSSMLDLTGKNSFRLKTNSTHNSANCSLRKNSRDSAYESQVELRRQCTQNHDAQEEAKQNVNNLREIYQSLLVRQNSDCSCKCGGKATSLYLQEQLDDLTEKGRLLTLEAKHSRRQRPSEPPTPPPVVEISNDTPNKCTIKILTPKAKRENGEKRPTEYVEPRIHQTRSMDEISPRKKSPSPKPTRSPSITPTPTRKRSISSSPLPPPPPPPTTSASTTLNSRTSRSSSQTRQYNVNQSATEEDTLSNHSECTEVTGISGTMTNSEFGGSIRKPNLPYTCNEEEEEEEGEDGEEEEEENSSESNNPNESVETRQHQLPTPEACQAVKKLKSEDYGAIFNTQIKGLRNDYSLNKYLNRRKSQEKMEICEESSQKTTPLDSPQLETNNNLKNTSDMDPNKLDVISLSSRSNRSSSRLSDRTKEMYRNAGVPVGIAYPQRSTANTSTSPNSATNTPATQATTNVQTVYRCEIEPVQLTHGMQIAMGLKDRPKKAKDIKNAWRKFVSMAASKFSPTQSPAPPFDKKTTSSILDALERDEGISSLIEGQPRVSSPKSTYSAPASQNYYEQRFGPRPLQEMDSGYMSADSGEALKRSFYDRYNFKLMTGRDHIIRVDTIEDNSDIESTSTDQQRSAQDNSRFEDFEHINEQQQEMGKSIELGAEDDDDDDEEEDGEGEMEGRHVDNDSDNDSDKTLTHTNTHDHSTTTRSSSSTTFNTSDEDDDDEHRTTSYGSSETDGETNPEDMWESGAESVETHSVLYKNVRKSMER